MPAPARFDVTAAGLVFREGLVFGARRFGCLACSQDPGARWLVIIRSACSLSAAGHAAPWMTALR